MEPNVYDNSGNTLDAPATVFSHSHSRSRLLPHSFLLSQRLPLPTCCRRLRRQLPNCPAGHPRQPNHSHTSFDAIASLSIFNANRKIYISFTLHSLRFRYIIQYTAYFNQNEYETLTACKAELSTLLN